MEFLLIYDYITYEVWIVLLSLGYIVVHVLDSLVANVSHFYHIFYPTKKPQKKSGRKKSRPTVVTVTENPVIEGFVSDTQKVQKLTDEQKQEITDITKKVKAIYARGNYSLAQEHIIRGLTIDKYHIDLNCLLAELYERRKDFHKAEMIYKDLILAHESHATDLYKHLGYALKEQEKTQLAYEVYKKAHEMDTKDKTLLIELVELAYDLEKFDAVIEFGKWALKFDPRHKQVLRTMAIVSIDTHDRAAALEYLKKLRELEPYNSEILQLIERVQTEIDMEHNLSSDTNP